MVLSTILIHLKNWNMKTILITLMVHMILSVIADTSAGHTLFDIVRQVAPNDRF